MRMRYGCGEDGGGGDDDGGGDGDEDGDDERTRLHATPFHKRARACDENALREDGDDNALAMRTRLR